MIKDIHIEVRSVAPLLMWRWPGDRPTQRMPKTKTQEWIEANWKEQWLRGLYSFKESDGTRVIGLPGENIFSTLKVAGSKLRLGDLINTYTLVLDPWVPLLVYKSAEDTKGVILRSNNMEEFYSEETRDIRMVKLNPSSRTGGKGDRCRPIEVKPRGLPALAGSGRGLRREVPPAFSVALCRCQVYTCDDE